jgi:hypothetical protein
MNAPDEAYETSNAFRDDQLFFNDNNTPINASPAQQDFAAEDDAPESNTMHFMQTEDEKHAVASAWQFALQKQSKLSVEVPAQFSPGRKSPTMCLVSPHNSSRDNPMQLLHIQASRSLSANAAQSQSKIWLSDSLLQAQLAFRQPTTLCETIAEQPKSRNGFNTSSADSKYGSSLPESKSDFLLASNISRPRSSQMATRLSAKFQLRVTCSRNSVRGQDDSSECNSARSARTASRLGNARESRFRAVQAAGNRNTKRRSRSSSPCGRKRG